MENKKENLEQVLIAFLQIAIVLAESFKDGVQAKDIKDIILKLQEPKVAEKLLDAYNNIEKVPHEIKSLNVLSVIGLVPVVFPKISELIEVIRK